MTVRLAQISDTHLSRDKPFFTNNFNSVAAVVAASRPDLIVNTGDMSLDGTGTESDLAEARRLHDGLGLPTRFIPGNHDVGESHDLPSSPELRFSEETRARYLRHFGDDFWLLDVPGWRLVALNTQLLGSPGLGAAGAQMEFLAQAVAGSGDSRIALFVHKPLFDASPEEDVVGGRFVNPQARRDLLAVFGPRLPALVASGHVHQHRVTTWRDTRCVWGPSTGFIIPDARQPLYGDKEVGYVEHLLHPDGRYESRFVGSSALQRLSIADFPDAYRHLEAPSTATARSANAS
jgi:3',5'-cyclic AMP phosphodiesterase CpdA